jgi:hypothetical protein
MVENRFLPRAAGIVPATLIFVCAVPIIAAKPDLAILTAVEFVKTSSETYRIVLSIQGRVTGIETALFDDGRFVFDLTPVVWNGPTRRERPGVRGIDEYRFSQYSRTPPVTRFVVEVEPGWTCLHEGTSEGLLITCDGAPDPDTREAAPPFPTVAVVRGFKLASPLAGLDAEKLIDRSLGFTPRDLVRDGLPHFGAMRDDWIGSPRHHKGLDIYIDKTSVQAVADGTMVGTGLGERSGGWATIRHGHGVETTYVHISDLRVRTGDDVTRGERIAVVDGAVGNAVEPQLHFELRLDGQSVDPVPYIYEQASEALKHKIAAAQQRLAALEEERARRVRSGVDGTRDRN